MPTLYYRKHLLEKLKKHLAIPSPPIQVLLGPRQVGKTTAITAYLKKRRGSSFYQTADQMSPPDAAWIEEQWKTARRIIERKSRGLLVLDEIQKIPRWSEVVKKCFDEDRRRQLSLDVVLLGSSSLLVQRGLTESLAGRFEVIPFPHWSFEECRLCFDINFEEFLFFGGYPGALKILKDSGFDEGRWGDYVRNALIETVLGKDILLLTPVAKPALFRQVFYLICAHAGEVLSFNKMLGQLQEAGNATTIASYLKLLEAAMLVKPLERYSGSRLRQKASSPKLLILNNALINAMLQRSWKEIQANRSTRGRLLENAIGASLANSAMGKGAELYYWQDRNSEVDFVLRLGEKILAIEVKSGPQEDFSSLNLFLRRFPNTKAIRTWPGGGDIPAEQLLTLTLDEVFAAGGFRAI